jgi:hypothetical protein
MDFRSIRSRLVYSALSVKYGQKLIRNMGIYCAARYLRNIGAPIEYALELLAMQPKSN